MLMKKIIISAPFGNYLTSTRATSTIGTYTVENRAGFLRWWLLWRILRTLRYRPSVGGWTNKLGLPNPGLEHLRRLALKMPDSWSDERIVSVHGFNAEEWRELLSAAASLGFMAVEINVSCPNVGHLSVPESLFGSAIKLFGPASVIVKVPPVSYWPTFELAYDSGVRIFHATNTLPVSSGGLSGKSLKRVSLDVVKRIKDARPDTQVIGGGGITTPEDVHDYKRAGASAFAVASAFLNPIRSMRRESFLAELERAAEETP